MDAQGLLDKVRADLTKLHSDAGASDEYQEHTHAEVDRKLAEVLTGFVSAEKERQSTMSDEVLTMGEELEKHLGTLAERSPSDTIREDLLLYPKHAQLSERLQIARATTKERTAQRLNQEEQLSAVLGELALTDEHLQQLVDYAVHLSRT